MMSTRLIRRAALLALVLTIVTAVAVSAQTTTLLQEVRAKNGMVAAASSYAAEVGAEMLKAGGNAVDAAVAAAFMIGVVEPNASGLGGEGMLVIYDAKEKKAVSIDYRAAAPKLAAEHYLGKALPTRGWASIGTPGTVAGLAMALEKYGTMTLAEVLAPAIKVAEEGFPITKVLADVIMDNYEMILADPELSRVFLDDGLPPEPGFVLKNTDLAATMRKIAEGGAEAFYRGELAQLMEKGVRANGGFMTASDLDAYRAHLRWPVTGTYRGYDIISAPPPVSGMTIIGALNIMENFDLASEPYFSPRNIHIMSEALKRAWVDRADYMADPDFVHVPLQELLDKGYARERAREINLEKMTPRTGIRSGQIKKPAAATGASLAATGTDGYESPSTTHISVIDKDGNMVALTQTISSFFGAGVMIPGTGVIPNNQMQNYTRATDSINVIAFNKRPRTTIAPTLVLKDGKPFLSVGTPGAARIIPTLVQIISGVIDHGMGLQEAIEMPRFFVRDTSEEFEYESRMPQSLIAGLKGLGYPINEKSVKGDYDLYFGGAQGVMVDQVTGELIGAADPRRDGAAAGH